MKYLELREDNAISPNFTDHFELYFPDEKIFSSNLPMERALSGR
jgi:hypothetical protein